jgi:hypothetical protein
MKKAKIILSVILAIYMLMAMGGLSLYNHMCSCKGKQITSVLIDKSCCQDTAEHDACHSDSHHNSCEDNTCGTCNCETQIEILKVENSIPTEQTISFIKVYQQIFLKALFTDNFFEFAQDIKPFFSNEGKPPPLTGKFIVILYQNLKIPLLIS